MIRKEIEKIKEADLQHLIDEQVIENKSLILKGPQGIFLIHILKIFIFGSVWGVN